MVDIFDRSFVDVTRFGVGEIYVRDFKTLVIVNVTYYLRIIIKIYRNSIITPFVKFQTPSYLLFKKKTLASYACLLHIIHFIMPYQTTFPYSRYLYTGSGNSSSRANLGMTFIEISSCISNFAAYGIVIFTTALLLLQVVHQFW